MIRPCKGDDQPREPGRYMVFVRKTDRWEVAVWGGKAKGWAIDGIFLNPVCWCPLPSKVTT